MKIFLAGAEASDNFEIIERGGIKNAFLSYYYLRKNSSEERLAFYRKNIGTIIVDSGAHTFFAENHELGLSTGVLKKKTKTKQSPESYFEDYKKWVKKYFQYFDYFVELDIGELVGQKKVLAWREELKALGLYKKCITVYHPDVMSWDDYIATLEDSQSKYVALEGDRSKRTRLPYVKLIKECYDRGIKVHGFAMTKGNVLEKYPFYSADSTSWRAGCQYGCAKVPTINGLENVRYTDQRAMMRVKAVNLLDLHNYDKRYVSVIKNYELTTKAYQEWQDHFTKLWEKRGIIWKD